MAKNLLRRSCVALSGNLIAKQLAGSLNRFQQSSKPSAIRLFTSQFNNSLLFSRSLHSEHVTTCWNCGQKYSSLRFFCEKCTAVQEISPEVNFFDMFDLEENFNMDRKELQRKFTNLQRQLHPDKFTSRSTREQNISLQNSALLNKAYTTLLKPLPRGIYMLKTKGIVFGEEVRADDPQFLLELMDINERVEESDTDAKVRLFDELQRKLNDVIKLVSHSFEVDDVEEARRSIIRLKYFTNISDRLREELPPR